MTASPLLKGLLAGLRNKRVREGSAVGCRFQERGSEGWKSELREWEERGSRRKEARERDERLGGVEDRLGSLGRIYGEEEGVGEPKKRRKGIEGEVSVATSTSTFVTASRPLSVQ